MMHYCMLLIEKNPITWKKDYHISPDFFQYTSSVTDDYGSTVLSNAKSIGASHGHPCLEGEGRVTLHCYL